MILACILDMDGVIVDTEPIHMHSFRKLLDEYKIHYTEQFIQSLVGFSDRENIIKIKQNLKINHQFDVDTEIRHRSEIYLELIAQQQLTPIQGIAEFITYCKDNHLKLGLASSSAVAQVDTIMQRLFNDYRSIFNTIVTGSDVVNKKPAPDIYNRVVENLKLDPLECMAFEDSQAGIASAKAAGLRCTAIRNRYTVDHFLMKADKIVNRITEALENNFWEF